jgi:hypothetical protein
MAHLTELTSAQQNFLNKPVIGDIRTKITLHTDDGDVVLNDDIIDVSPISLRKRVDLDNKQEQFTVSELRIRLQEDATQQFDSESGGLFELFKAPTVTALGLLDDTVDLFEIDPLPFGAAALSGLVGRKTTLTDGRVTWQDEIDSITNVTSGSDTLTRITFANSYGINYEFSAGAYLIINDLIGREATVEHLLGDTGETITQGRWVIAQMPAAQPGEREIVLQDLFYSLMQSQLYASVVELKEYQRSGSSAGTFDITYAAIASQLGYTTIGEYELEITADNGSYYDFTVTLPDGSERNGRTDQDWWSDSKNSPAYTALEIDSDGWTGSFDVGDKVIFECYFKEAGSATHMVDSLLAIVQNSVGASYTASTDITADIKSRLPAIGSTVRIKKAMSRMAAVSTLCEHLNLSIYPGRDAKVHFFFWQPVLNETPPAIGADDIMEMDIEQSLPVSGIQVNYNYDWDNRVFLNSVTYPENYTGELIELDLGLFTTKSQALFQAQFYEAMHGRGLRIANFAAQFANGIGWDLSDIFQVTSLKPGLTNRLMMIFDYVKNCDSRSLICKGLDIEFMWSDFLFYDNDQRYDNRYVYW